MRISVNGTQLYFDVEGASLRVDGGPLTERPTIVALHGGPGFDQGYLRPPPERRA
jgi:proline iminopeptidase